MRFYQNNSFYLLSIFYFAINLIPDPCSAKEFRFVMNNNICRDYDVRLIVIVSSAVQNKVV